MQLRFVGSVLIGGALCAGVAACSKTDAPAAEASGSGGAVAYEVVTVERPESVEAYHKLYRATYDMCAVTRQNLKLPPPPPMKVPPSDFISQRTTYTSDGKAYLVKEEHFLYKVSIGPCSGDQPSGATSRPSGSTFK